MDVGEYETNTFVVSNIASIAFRVYRPVVSSSPSVYTSSAPDVEKALRNDGHLVFADTRRQCIWCFRLMRRDGSAMGSPAKSELATTMDVGPYKLIAVDDGAFEPISLLKGSGGRPHNTVAVNTPNSSSSAVSAFDSTARSTTGPASQSAGLLPLSQTSNISAAASDLDTHSVHSQAATQPDQKGLLPVSAKVVYNFFISAVLAGLSSAYCAKARAIALNSRTLLLPPLDPLWDGDERSRSDGRALIATLRVTLTTAGSLLLYISHTVLHGMGCSEWACYAGIPPEGCAVLTAPWGKFATVRGVYQPPMPAGMGLKRKQVSATSAPLMWKNFASKMLETRGISPVILQNSSWLRIEFSLSEEAPNDVPVVMLWPSVLCFWSLESPTITTAPSQRLDPLSDIREAYLEETKEDDPAAKLEDMDVPMEDIQMVADDKGKRSVDRQPLSGALNTYNNVSINSAAAAAAAASANSAALGAMYPTPPDGVLNAVGVTPTFDGSTSSPGNMASTTALAYLDGSVPQLGAHDASLGDFWDSGEPKREEQEEPFTAEPDALFGDIGADIFGDDITDADFNFFDEKPDRADAGASSAVSDKMDMVESPQQASPQADQQEPPPTEVPQMEEAVPEEKTPSRPESPVFAKPELKNARSNLPGESQAVKPASNALDTKPVAAGIKRPPSPFDALTVFKRIRATTEDSKSQKVAPKQPFARRGNLFQGLKFSDFMIENNKKYEQNGKFGFRWPHPETDMLSDLSMVTSPTAFRRPTGKQANPSDSSPEWAALITSITRGLKSSSLQAQSFLDDSEDSSSGSSEDALSSEDTDDDDEAMTVSSAPRKPDMSESMPTPEAAAELSRAYSEGVWDVPIARYFVDPMPPPTELAYTDNDVIDVAQILTQQVTRMTIRSGFDEDEARDLQKTKLRNTLLQRIRYSVATLHDVLPAALDEATRCSLKPYLDVQDIPLLVQPARPRQPLGQEQLRPNVFHIPTPHVEIQRHEWTLSLAPTAIDFWDTLALEPLHGSKEIRAVCVYPDFDGLDDEVNGFLNRMRIVYESLRLGSHDRLSEKSGHVTEGMVSFDARVSSGTPSGIATPRPEFAGADQVHRLAQALAAEDAQGKSLVVYFVYCEEVTGAVVDACLAFQRLSQLYEMAVTGCSSEPGDLVLQLIPTSFLASPTALVVPTPADLLRLSLEVYDRCASARGPRPAPAFLLEQPPPRMLDLRLSATPSVDVQRENSCIHVAYARSTDERWMTAAWTDSSGWRQFSSAYWVGRKGRLPATSFAAVAQEIWDNTCAIVGNLKVNWRAIITKCGPMEPEEMEAWTELAKAETRASISVTLVTVDTQPCLELIPPVVMVPPTVLPLLSAATPAPTPQASAVFSPEQSGNPSADANLAAAGADPNAVAEIDGNVALVDVTDNAWGAIASHRLNIAATWIDQRPALVSGYLVKRGGLGRDDAPVVLEVNVIRTEGSPRTYEQLVRELLSSFRGLGTLARARGILDGERDVRPWHIAAAERAAKALCRWM
ncbi:hypothetical protein CMQ_5994 [Grosmannia clavigera kw1407]|uniref:Mediator of RNA polymerase II transcription subunit 13 n=1 Tax=Grosmannia clavigera (strain kw1407 / UAMH 11150) TaxID=655863 RepID=F0XLV4_GROCL|nr:uncharacterized protein CMQ_5994 [Grosmannia clavigera kw1407]EFX01052.1 hypothetical protein CMQ_5994 [Grosmannia clavigera kw1407]